MKQFSNNVDDFAAATIFRARRTTPSSQSPSILIDLSLYIDYDRSNEKLRECVPKGDAPDNAAFDQDMGYDSKHNSINIICNESCPRPLPSMYLPKSMKDEIHRDKRQAKQNVRDCLNLTSGRGSFRD